MFKKLIFLAGLLMLPSVAQAQTAAQGITGFLLAQGSTYNGYTCPTAFTSPCFVQYGSTLPVSGTFSASLAGFTPTAASTANLSVTSTSNDVALPATIDAVVTNTGPNTAFFRIQTGAGVAVATDEALVAGAAAGIHLGSATHLSAISASGQTATLSIQGGTGLVTGYGGGSSGGGSSGAVFGPTAVGSAAANPPVLIAGTANAGATGNVQVLKISATGVASVDGSSVTQPVSASSLPLPTGAATSALQPTNASQGSTTSGQTGRLVLGAVTTSAPNYTTGQTNPISLDANGSVRVNVTSATGVTQGSTTSGQTISPIGGAVTTSAPSYTTGQTSPISLDTAGNTRVNCVTGCSSATVGTSFTLTAAASTNATSVKASAGTLRHISVYNNSATLAWVSFYNTASTPTCGTGIVYQTMIPSNSTSGAGAVEDISAGLTFSTGIGICVTTGIAGTGSVAATSYVIGLGYN